MKFEMKPNVITAAVLFLSKTITSHQGTKQSGASLEPMGKPLSRVTDIIEWMEEDDPRVPI
jgi:hypothetical protein